MLTAVALVGALTARAEVAAAEVPKAIVVRERTPEMEYRDQVQAWKEQVRVRDKRRRVGIGLAVAGSIVSSVFGTLMLVEALDRPQPVVATSSSAPAMLFNTRDLGRGLVEGACLGFMSIGGALIVAGVPLIIHGSLKPDRPASPPPMVYGSLGPGSARLTFSF